MPGSLYESTGRGIGSLALGKLQSEGAAMGIGKLVANVSSGNTQSLVFHTQAWLQGMRPA
jgi:L-amino acid N-acyltransferase YncA